MGTSSVPDSSTSYSIDNPPPHHQHHQQQHKRYFTHFYIFHSFLRIISYVFSTASIPLIWWRITYSNPEMGYSEGSPYLSTICAPNVIGGPILCQDTVFHDTPNPLLRSAQMIGFISLIMVVVSYWLARLIRRWLIIRRIRKYRRSTTNLDVQLEQEFLLASSSSSSSSTEEDNNVDNSVTTTDPARLLRQSMYRLALLRYFVWIDSLALFFQVFGFAGFTIRTKEYFTEDVLPIAEQTGSATVTYEGIGKTTGSIMCFTAIICSCILFLLTNIFFFRERRMYRLYRQEQQSSSSDLTENTLYPFPPVLVPNNSIGIIPTAPNMVIVNTIQENTYVTNYHDDPR